MRQSLANNQEIAAVFNTIADILDIKGENAFRIRAYRRASQQISQLSDELATLPEARRQDIPGIGADLGRKIDELISTGRLAYFDELKQSLPQGVLDMLTIPGVGPRTAKAVFEELHIDSVEKLEQAARSHRLQQLAGFKKKTEANILHGIDLIRQGKARLLLSQAQEAADEIIRPLQGLKAVRQIRTAGSLRRQKETVRDIDILVTSSRPQAVMDAVAGLAAAQEVLSHGRTKTAIRTAAGIQVDVRVVAPESFGAALVYFTGSKAHNIRIRDLAKRQGLKLNEYGVFAEKTGQRVAGSTEEEVYQALGLAYVEPELREDSGEIEAAQAGALPKLVTEKSIRGDTHAHSNWSDGKDSIEAMARAMRERGYEYMVLSDHSQSLGIAAGLSPQRLRQQIARVKVLNKKFKDFRILCAAEVDIKPDGRLDFDEDILAELDIVLAAVHSGFKQSRDTMTRRLAAAMHQPRVNIIVHPLGRVIGERSAYEVDWDEILRIARGTNTALEINCYPKRLDMDDIHSRAAKDAGVMIALGSDSHSVAQTGFMRWGVAVARRAWLEQKDVLNCLSCEELLQWTRAKRQSSPGGRRD